ncbi:hypothetical protein [Sphingomonas oryzagri]|uniref:Restriction alleviation protein Lar n=1 Tax=Sphingomonas oryzagri TaxID=3042314 RepID=A0ABT6N164_9SPHN|nr:hypothetical protein [Sphingomonas oryzagri]MDH7638977.1 hypothetical protein [Sphingomonas oryzagri]
MPNTTPDPSPEREGLRECPWCAGEARIVETDGEGGTFFPSCTLGPCPGFQSAPFTTYLRRHDAIARWNTRASTHPGRPTREEVACDSDDYKQDFFGILNAQGKFWTPLAFIDEQQARKWLEAFVAKNPERFGDMLTTHTIVPVRIQLSTIRSLGGEA